MSGEAEAGEWGRHLNAASGASNLVMVELERGGQGGDWDSVQPR